VLAAHLESEASGGIDEYDGRRRNLRDARLVRQFRQLRRFVGRKIVADDGAVFRQQNDRRVGQRPGSRQDGKLRGAVPHDRVGVEHRAQIRRAAPSRDREESPLDRRASHDQARNAALAVDHLVRGTVTAGGERQRRHD